MLHDVAVGDFRSKSSIVQVLPNLVGQHDGPVLPSSASERNR
jgi:hypothetical protein